jgi:hypothetical protein
MKLRGFSLLAAVAAFAVLAAPAGAARRPIKLLETANLLGPSHAFHDTVLARSPNVRRLFDSGGQYTTKDGMTVNIDVSSSYAPDPVRDQAIADFLDSLAHGTELSKLTVYVGTFPEVQGICGTAALACYLPGRASLFVPGEDPPDGTPVEQIITHEYGHHVAAFRSNPPWNAVEWGPKHWASYMGICPRQAAGLVFPGDEGAHYSLNPGEAWAETFRVLNVQLVGAAAGWTDIGWPIVDPIFLPDATALANAQADVLQPWTVGTVKHATGKLKKNGVRRFTIKTPLDGNAAATLTSSHGATAVFFDVKGHPLSTRSASTRALVCGETSVMLSVRAKAGGTFKLAYVAP